MKANRLVIGVVACGALLLADIGANAQAVNTGIFATGSRNFIRNIQNEKEYQGSPYLYDEYKEAFVRLKDANPALYAVKYDQLADALVVKGENKDEEYLFSDPVVEFKFKDSQRLFRTGFAPTGTTGTSKSYYEVLFDGTTKYLKKNGKMIIEAKGYNTSTITKKVEEDPTFYIVKGDNKPILVKNNERSILGVLDHTAELTKYIKDNKLNMKTDADVAKLLTYYDSLNTTSK